MAQIIKYSNEFNKIRVGSLTKRELNIFLSIIYKSQDQGLRTLKMKFSELRNLEETNDNHNSELIKRIKSMTKKLILLNMDIETSSNLLIFTLFNKFDVDKNNNTLEIEINKEFEHMLNSLTNKFTYFELQEFIRLDSKYSKILYKYLRQYRGNKWHKISLDEFKERLGIPKSYRATDINKKVLTPIFKELNPIFKNLKIEKLTKDGQLVGRGKKTHSFKFSWDDLETRQEKTLLQNIIKKQDKAIIEANKKAKIKIEKQYQERESKKKENIKSSSALENIMGNIAQWCFKNEKLKLTEQLSEITTLEDLDIFMKKYNIVLEK